MDLGSANSEEITLVVQKIINQESVDHFGEREKIQLWNSLIGFLANRDRARLLPSLLRAIRILTRDGHFLARVVDRHSVLELARCANIPLIAKTKADSPNAKNDLQPQSKVSPKTATPPSVPPPAAASAAAGNGEASVEALACLSNIYLQCPSASNSTTMGSLLVTRGILEVLARNCKQRKVEKRLLGLYTRVLFLATAQSNWLRDKLIQEEELLGHTASLLNHLVASGHGIKDSSTLREKDAPVISNLLRLVYSCLYTIELDPTTNEVTGTASHSCNEATFSTLLEVCRTLRHLILTKAENLVVKNAVISDSISVLSAMPLQTMAHLFGKGHHHHHHLLDHHHHHAPCVKEILAYLSRMLDEEEGSLRTLSLRDCVAPVLKLLCCISRGFSRVRKYAKGVVLPPLKEVRTRPEEGHTLRNKLCRLLTNPDTLVSTLAADFLFILCREDVDRLVKYTGYGNAAGLLAKRGLLLGGNKASKVYSDTDTDSDTEEYKRNIDRINPVTGHITPLVASPFEDMTDEQKEHEAVKLAHIMNRMQDLGVGGKPGKVDDLGKPSPVSHMMELREAMANFPWIHSRSSGSSGSSGSCSSHHQNTSTSVTHHSR